MITRFRDFMHKPLIYVTTMGKWFICALTTGVLCGCIGTAFSFAVDHVTDIRNDYSWMLYLLPLAGVVIVFIYRLLGMKNDKGTNLVIESIRSREKVPLVMAPLIFTGTVLTHLCGGSSGREGAALQIGGSLGSFLGKIFHLSDEDISVITMCGMSAVFSALFGTPLTAAIFSMEVVSVGVIYYSAFFPCVVSAITAYSIAHAAGAEAIGFTINTADVLLPSTLMKAGLIAAGCAVVSIIFVVTMHKSKQIFTTKIKNSYLRIITGGAIIVLLTLIIGNDNYNGAGISIINNALEGQSYNFAFLIKIIFTSITLGCGFKGGEIIPALFIGATFGNSASGLIQFDRNVGAASGMIAVFCSVVNCPISALFMSLEMFGSSNIILFALVCAVSYMLSGYYSLYSSQKIVYSKLRATLKDKT